MTEAQLALLRTVSSSWLVEEDGSVVRLGKPRPRGPRFGRPKVYALTAESVAQLRADRAAGMTWDALAKRYGCAANTVRAAALGKTWGGVP